MSDFTLAPSNTGIVGMTGSGKTTFAIRYLLNAPAACHFIFDDYARASTRLKIPRHGTIPNLEKSLASRWSLFNPDVMFPGDRKAAFRWFCQWVYDTSRRGPGKKHVLVDEIWQHCTDNALPRELAVLSQMGREENIELIWATQRPELVNASITGACTELICFRLNEPDALRTVRALGADREAVAALPMGSFISYDRLHGGEFTGRVFG